MNTQNLDAALSHRMPGKKPPKPELFAARFVRRMGIRPNLTDYRYLITAIELGLRCPHLLTSLTHELYPAVAWYYRVKVSTVERNMRKAIETAYNNDPQRLHSLFYYKVSKPYVSEVIALAVDNIQIYLNDSAQSDNLYRGLPS